MLAIEMGGLRYRGDGVRAKDGGGETDRNNGLRAPKERDETALRRWCGLAVKSLWPIDPDGETGGEEISFMEVGAVILITYEA